MKDVRPAADMTSADAGHEARWKPTTVAEFLDLDEPTMRCIDLRIGLTGAIIRLRQERGLTQAALAKLAGLARPRITEIEARRHTTSFDTLLPVFFAAGGTAAELIEIVKATDRAMDR